LQEYSTIQYYVRGISGFYNSFLKAYGADIDVQTPLTLSTPLTYDLTSITDLTTVTYKSTIMATTADAMLTDPFNNAAPNLKPAADSPVLTGALFDFGTLGDAFFDKVAYRGAFDGTTDWTASWAVWGK